MNLLRKLGRSSAIPRNPSPRFPLSPLGHLTERYPHLPEETRLDWAIPDDSPEHLHLVMGHAWVNGLAVRLHTDDTISEQLIKNWVAKHLIPRTSPTAVPDILQEALDRRATWARSMEKLGTRTFLGRPLIEWVDLLLTSDAPSQPLPLAIVDVTDYQWTEKELDFLLQWAHHLTGYKGSLHPRDSPFHMKTLREYRIEDVTSLLERWSEQVDMLYHHYLALVDQVDLELAVPSADQPPPPAAVELGRLNLSALPPSLLERIGWNRWLVAFETLTQEIQDTGILRQWPGLPGISVQESLQDWYRLLHFHESLLPQLAASYTTAQLQQQIKEVPTRYQPLLRVLRHCPTPLSPEVLRHWYLARGVEAQLSSEEWSPLWESATDQEYANHLEKIIQNRLFHFWGQPKSPPPLANSEDSFPIPVVDIHWRVSSMPERAVMLRPEHSALMKDRWLHWNTLLENSAPPTHWPRPFRQGQPLWSGELLAKKKPFHEETTTAPSHSVT